MVSVAEQSAQELEKEAISVEIVDIRTIVPLDEEIILQSVEKTSNFAFFKRMFHSLQLLQKYLL